MPLTTVSRVWKGAIVGALIGCASLVSIGPFKGNLGEPQFFAEYMGYLIPATAIGAFAGWSKQRREIPDQPARQSKAFLVAATVLLLFVVTKVATDFPDGEGLFHPTHAANVAQAKIVCLGKLDATTTAPQEAKEAYCSCWADQVALAAEMSAPLAPQIFARKADSACRRQ